MLRYVCLLLTFLSFNLYGKVYSLDWGYNIEIIEKPDGGLTVTGFHEVKETDSKTKNETVKRTPFYSFISGDISPERRAQSVNRLKEDLDLIRDSIRDFKKKKPGSLPWDQEILRRTLENSLSSNLTILSSNDSKVGGESPKSKPSPKPIKVSKSEVEEQKPKDENAKIIMADHPLFTSQTKNYAAGCDEKTINVKTRCSNSGIQTLITEYINNYAMKDCGDWQLNSDSDSEAFQSANRLARTRKQSFRKHGSREFRDNLAALSKECKCLDFEDNKNFKRLADNLLVQTENAILSLKNELIEAPNEFELPMNLQVALMAANCRLLRETSKGTFYIIDYNNIPFALDSPGMVRVRVFESYQDYLAFLRKPITPSNFYPYGGGLGGGMLGGEPPPAAR